MPKHLLAAAMLAVLSGFVCSEPSKPLVIMEYGNTFSIGTFPNTGEWHGLYCNALDCEVKRANVRIARSTTKHIDDEDVPIESLEADESPLALVHGFPIKPGKVTTWFNADKPMYESVHYSKLRKLGRWQMPWGTTPLTISWVKLPEYGGFRYHLGDGLTKQFIFRTELQSHYGGDTAPFVHWVGDLDSDGKIDLLLSLPDDNCGFDYRLYLSSQASKGEFVRKAAQFAGSHAACGC